MTHPGFLKNHDPVRFSAGFRADELRYHSQNPGKMPDLKDADFLCAGCVPRIAGFLHRLPRTDPSGCFDLRPAAG
jgi:hypothetical protein